MSLVSLLTRLQKALPVIIANLPVVAGAAKEVKKALKEKKKRAGEAA
jgi:hypothetical protein